MRFPRRQRSFLLGRRAAKEALSVCFPNRLPSEIEVVNGAFNQPFVRSAAPISAEISLAHSHDAAVALVCPAGHPAGVDVEFVDPERSEVAGSCFTPSEAPVIQRLGLSTSAANFLLWSVKEALGKTLRCGLAVPFATLAVESVTESDGVYESLFINFPPFKARSWMLGDYVLSIVLPKKTSMAFKPSHELISLMSATEALSC